MADTYATSFETPNFSGALFNAGNTKTPFSSLIGSRRKKTNSVEFVTGQEYTTDGGTQPNISETASLTAPEASVKKRTQKTNVTQIFHESVGVSYAKMSNMGTLSGVNIAGQQANPMNELDFQTGAKMAKIARDIEYTFLNGAYNKATTDATANKTRGMFTAITTNALAMETKPLTLWGCAQAMQKIYESNAPVTDLVLWCDATTLFQLNVDAAANELHVAPADRTVNGIQLSSIITPLGVLYLYLGEFVPAGTAGIFNLDVISPVEQDTPGKGNFFRELLAKTGAGEKYQIFGQIGLDHGPEWYHAKITGISTDFAPPAGKNVVVTNAADFPAGGGAGA